jgi:hypothetical protein
LVDLQDFEGKSFLREFGGEVVVVVVVVVEVEYLVPIWWWLCSEFLNWENNWGLGSGEAGGEGSVVSSE